MWGMTKKRVYLDWAAAAPVSPTALSVFTEAQRAYGNPGSPHTEGRIAKSLLDEARERIARLAEVKTDGVVFTSGATEANALAILGVVRAHGVANAHVLYQESQHASVIGAIELLKTEGATVEAIDLAQVSKQLRPETVLVTLDAVNSETGEVFDTLAVRRVLDAHSKKSYLHVDGSQVPLTGSFTLAHLGADLVTLDAQKVGAVRGVGALLLRHGVALEPLMRGGGQERGRRPGTENAPLAMTFASALGESQLRREKFSEKAVQQRELLLTRIQTIKNVEVNEGKEKVPHILNVSFIGRDTDYLVALLDTEGFAVSTKSACETDSEQGSRPVFALTGDQKRATSTLRISWGPTTSDEGLERFAEALIRTVRFLDEHAIY